MHYFRKSSAWLRSTEQSQSLHCSFEFNSWNDKRNENTTKRIKSIQLCFFIPSFTLGRFRFISTMMLKRFYWTNFCQTLPNYTASLPNWVKWKWSKIFILFWMRFWIRTNNNTRSMASLVFFFSAMHRCRFFSISLCVRANMCVRALHKKIGR